MKRCPECRKDYLDDSLLYCLDDGTPLVQGTVTDEPATVILSEPPALAGGQSRSESPTRPLTNTTDQTAILPAGAEAEPQKTLGDSPERPRFWHKERASVAGTPQPSAHRAAKPLLIFGIVALVLIAGFFGYAYFSKTNSNDKALRLSFEPPKNLQFNDSQADWAVISPDGEKIAFTANTPDGKYLLYVNDLKTGQITELPGSDNALEPFWSPDSRAIAYGSRGKLKRSDISGGNAQVLTDAPRLTAGAWNKTGDIIFGADYGSPMFTVSAKGGEARQITFQEGNGDGQHSGGTFLPDGKHFIFNRGATSADLRGEWLGSLDSKEVKRIMPENWTVRFAPPDSLIMVRNQVLVAQKIDTSTVELVGDPIPIIKDVLNAEAAPARFSVSTNGVLIWQPQWTRNYQLRFYDREGKQTGAIGKPEFVSGGQTPRISPNGKQVAWKSTNGILASNLDGSNAIKLGDGQLPVWSPDGSRIAFNASIPDKGRGIFQRASNGVGEPELLVPGTVFTRQYSPDGRFLMYTKRGAKTRLDVYLTTLLGDRKEIPLLASPADEIYAEISPNGKWLAYSSDESGSYELYVQSLTADGTLGNDRKRVSTDGGMRFTWGRDGRQIYFIARDSKMMSADVKTDGPAFEYGPPKPLFETRMIFQYGGSDFFDVTPDGKFLIGTLVGEPTSPAPTVILNWTAALNK